MTSNDSINAYFSNLDSDKEYSFVDSDTSAISISFRDLIPEIELWLNQTPATGAWQAASFRRLTWLATSSRELTCQNWVMAGKVIKYKTHRTNPGSDCLFCENYFSFKCIKFYFCKIPDKHNINVFRNTKHISVGICAIGRPLYKTGFLFMLFVIEHLKIQWI